MCCVIQSNLSKIREQLPYNIFQYSTIEIHGNNVRYFYSNEITPVKHYYFEKNTYVIYTQNELILELNKILDGRQLIEVNTCFNYIDNKNNVCVKYN